MPMNDFVAQFYKTASASTPAVDDAVLQEDASLQMFLKVASDQEIDLTTLTDEQINGLYATFKTASEEATEKSEEEKKKDKDDEEKHAAAAVEFAAKKEASDKVAEADYCGRVMAHSFVQELSFIEKEAAGSSGITHAGVAANHLRHAAGAIGAKAKGVAEAAKGHAGHAAEAVKDVATAKQLRGGHAVHKWLHGPDGIAAAGKSFAHGMSAAKTDVKAKKDMLHGGAKTVGLYGAAAGTAAGGAAAVHHHNKHASALDLLALEEAVKVAGDGGFDTDEAASRVDAIVTLGFLGESEKVASAPDYSTGVGIRALELLEAAGYPVTWNA